jgi:gluconokinase
LRAGSGVALRFICLVVARPELERRMAQRKGHFMPPGLLDSQLATFEPPNDETDALIIDGNASQEEQLARADAWLANFRGS